MTPSSDIRSYYLDFIHNAYIAKRGIEAKLKEATTKKEELKEYITDNFYEYKSKHDIVITTYAEFINEAPSEYGEFVLAVNKAIKNTRNVFEKHRLYKLLSYITIINKIDKLNKDLDRALYKCKLKFTEYRNYVCRFYNAVHKHVLKGGSYKFSNGIGSFIINYWKTNALNRIKTVDFNATRIRKQELLAQSVKVWDDKEAAWYKARRIPYNAVDYRVYRDANYYYEMRFIKSRIVISSKYEFEHAEYLGKNLRGECVETIAEKYCHNIEDIYTMPMDIKFKLNVLLCKDPTKYLNFIRNAEQRKYKPRKDNSED